MAALDSQPGGTPKLCSSVERTVERRSKITIVKNACKSCCPDGRSLQLCHFVSEKPEE